MVVSVLVVLLLTVFYEVLKVWRLWLGNPSKLTQPQSPYDAPSSHCDSISVLDSSPSESSLTPIASVITPQSTRNR